MGISDNVISQGFGSYVAHLNKLRLDQLTEMLSQILEKEIAALSVAEKRFIEAISYVDKMKEFLGQPEHILGSDLTKHGEIAERLEVYMANAWDVLRGRLPTARIDNVERTGPIDYYLGDAAVQSKFYNGLRETLNACREHYMRYADNSEFSFSQGAFYQIPKDQFEHLTEIMSKRSSELSGSENSIAKLVHQMEAEKGQKYTDFIKSGRNIYAQVQREQAGETIRGEVADLEDYSNREADSIKDTAKRERESAIDKTKPTMKEAGKAAALGAGISGGITFTVNIYKKIKEGKPLVQFTKDDWEDVGIDTAKATVKGGISGSGIYVFSNYGQMPTPMAGAYVSATLGVVEFSKSFRKGEMGGTEFIEGCELIAIESAIASIGGALGQVLIPIPVLGAMIGSVVAGTLADIGEKYLNEHEKQLMYDNAEEMSKYIQTMDEQIQEEINNLLIKFDRWNSMTQLAFDPNINLLQLKNSIHLAQEYGVDDAEILYSLDDIDTYFCK